jgi:hypothetical protein
MYPCLDFAGPDFIWPSKMNGNGHREIFDFIVDPEWKDVEQMLSHICISSSNRI